MDDYHSTTQFTSDGLNAGDNYIGATWVGRSNAFMRQFREVSAQSSKRLTLESAPVGFYYKSEGNGFILVDKMQFLGYPKCPACW